MTQTLNIKYFYIRIYKYLIFSLACLYHPTYSYLLMLTYLAAISTNLAPAGLIYSQLTSRPGCNSTKINVSDRATNELKVSHLTSCNHPLKIELKKKKRKKKLVTIFL